MKKRSARPKRRTVQSMFETTGYKQTLIVHAKQTRNVNWTGFRTANGTRRNPQQVLGGERGIRNRLRNHDRRHQVLKQARLLLRHLPRQRSLRR